MSEFQSKIGGGLNKLQDSLQQGKHKLQVAQETSQFRKKVQVHAQTRAKLMIELGEAAYRKIRSKELEDGDLLKNVEVIAKHDKEMFKAQKMISLLTSQTQDAESCTCGSPITSDMKFCGSCGQKVEIVATSIEEEKYCGFCEEGIPMSARYCTCCGVQQEN
ncbi:zinc ribbon domain-containing protein [Rossellomorea arthrocnemi]